ncbi:MAG TPA: MATE family efflux transporter [Candidatus Faecivivens stercorigallinarum]|nr:MATE family efflux transporter [Candidatus Faecivivens stercorigallinarum]
MKLITRDRSFYRSLIALAIPVALQNLITFAVSFADNLMVGSLGDAAVSGVYMGSQIQTFLQMFSGGIEGAILILAAQYWGKRDTASIKRIIAIGLHFSIGFGLLLTTVCVMVPRPIISLFTDDAGVIADGALYLRIVCFSYLFFCITQALIASMRSVEVARIGMGVSLISLIVNVSLNYILIFGKFGFPAMGIAGAAVATVISRIAETLTMWIYVTRIDRKLELKLKELLVSDPVLRRDFIRYGLPLIGGNVVWSVNMMANSAILGRFSASVITAASIANTMNSLAYVTMNGMSSAVGIITGKTVGAGKTERMKEYAYTVQLLFLGMGLLTGGVIILLKSPFIGLYSGITAEAISYSSQFITVLSITMIGTCYQAAGLFGLVKSGGDIGFVFKNDTIFVFLVVLPSAIIASILGAPAWVVFACLKCDQILKCFVAVVKINRFDWMKNLTRDKRLDQPV